MNGPNASLVLHKSIDVPPEEVYPAFTSALSLMEWLADDARVDARPGGRLYLFWSSGHHVIGEYVEVEPDRRIALRWHGRDHPGPTAVEVLLEPERGGAGTSITLTHSGFGADERWQEPRRAIRARWTDALDNLASVLEEGLDLRVFSRPMLGISSGLEVNAEMARSHDLAVERGVMLTDFVEGLGAEAACLERGDVLVRLGGHAVDGWESLTAAIGAHTVGETVEIEYYRGAELRRAEVTLLGRPRPRVPESGERAAEFLREAQARLMAVLRRHVSGASEQAMVRRPAAGEWSALEVLAHLLNTERSVQVWLALRVQGESLPLLASEEECWIRATSQVWPSAAAMLYALEQAQAQTAAMVAALPPAFVARRASFVAACDLLFVGLPYHARSHVAQLAEALGLPV